MNVRLFPVVAALGLSILISGAAFAEGVQSNAGPREVETNIYCDPSAPCTTFAEHDTVSSEFCGSCAADSCYSYPWAWRQCCTERWECCTYWDPDYNRWRTIMQTIATDTWCYPSAKKEVER